MGFFFFGETSGVSPEQIVFQQLYARQSDTIAKPGVAFTSFDFRPCTVLKMVRDDDGGTSSVFIMSAGRLPGCHGISCDEDKFEEKNHVVEFTTCTIRRLVIRYTWT